MGKKPTNRKMHKKNWKNLGKVLYRSILCKTKGEYPFDKQEHIQQIRGYLNEYSKSSSENK